MLLEKTEEQDAYCGDISGSAGVDEDGHDPCLSGRNLRGDPDRFPDITEHKSMSGETGRKEKEWSKKKLQAAIEAIFCLQWGGSVELKKLAQAIGHDEETTKKIIRQMMDRYEKEDRGIRIIELEASFQMCTKKEMYEYLIRVAKAAEKTGSYGCTFGNAFDHRLTSSRLQNWKSKKSVASNRIMQSASW